MKLSRIAILLTAVFASWTGWATPAAADMIGIPITFYDSSGSEMTLQQALIVAGNSVYLLYDLGTNQEWTSAENANVNLNLLDLILDLGGDSVMIAELFQPGAVFASFELVTTTSATSSQDEGGSLPDSSSVPEPATLSLLGASLAMLGFYAVFRMRRLRAAPVSLREPQPDVSLQRTH